MLRRYKTSVRYIKFKDFSLLSFKVNNCTKEDVFKSLKVKDLVGNRFEFYESFDRCNEHNIIDPKIREPIYVIIFEVLLNIIQHNYREHVMITEEEIDRRIQEEESYFERHYSNVQRRVSLNGSMG
jgi:hypothetical protein